MAEKSDDLTLPLSVISRLINDAIPESTNVSAEARKVICKTASVFILYTTATAGSMATKHGRKTMNANDVIEAIEEMEFSQFSEPLKKCLQAYRNSLQEKKKNTATKKSLDGESTRAASSSVSANSFTTTPTPSSSSSAKKAPKSPPRKRASPQNKSSPTKGSPPSKSPTTPKKKSPVKTPEIVDISDSEPVSVSASDEEN